MLEIIVKTRDGNTQTVEAEVGLSVMEIIRNAGVDEMMAICGGCCSCATCHVYVDDKGDGVFPPVTDDENDLLDSSDQRQQNSRLACQVQFTEAMNGLTVEIAPEG